MNVVSVCSGVGGLDLGLERAGMTITHQCEIDPHCRDVLARHWPDTPIHHDLTTLDGSTLGHVDLVAGGTPCTDLSVAGRRAGLAGEQSRIFWDFCRVAADSAARWVLWENVVGALSSNGGEDFAAVLWGLTGFHPAVPPDGWRSIGVCVGPDRAAVWRVLDARWFGVAQRRRRVFVVAGPREQCSLEVLVEPESVPRCARPGGASGSVVAALTAHGVGAGGGVDDNAAQAGHLVVDLAQITSPANRSDPQPGDPAPSLTSTGRPITFGWSNAATQGDEVEIDLCSPLRADGQRVGSGKAVAYPGAVRRRTTCQRSDKHRHVPARTAARRWHASGSRVGGSRTSERSCGGSSAIGRAWRGTSTNGRRPRRRHGRRPTTTPARYARQDRARAAGARGVRTYTTRMATGGTTRWTIWNGSAAPAT